MTPYKTRTKLQLSQVSDELIGDISRRRTHAAHNPMAITEVMAAGAITVTEATGNSSTEGVIGWPVQHQTAYVNSGAWITTTIITILICLAAYLYTCDTVKLKSRWRGIINLKAMQMAWLQNNWQVVAEKVLSHQSGMICTASLTASAATMIMTHGASMIALFMVIATVTYKTQQKQRDWDYFEAKLEKLLLDKPI